MARENKTFDPFPTRGMRGFNALGALTLAVGRLADPVIQTAILCTPTLTPLFQRLGVIHHPAIIPSLSATSLQTLSEVPLPRLLLLTLSTINALDQAYWAFFINQAPFQVSSAIAISITNIVFASLWSILYLARATSSAIGDEQPTPLMFAAFGIAVAGLLIERTSERQRQIFKADPVNKGKLYTGGLFRFARHVNYTGFTLSRVSPALLSSGYATATMMGSVCLWDLGGRAAGVLDDYCGKRYGEQWSAYKKRVPYVMIPGLY